MALEPRLRPQIKGPKKNPKFFLANLQKKTSPKTTFLKPWGFIRGYICWQGAEGPKTKVKQGQNKIKQKRGPLIGPDLTPFFCPPPPKGRRVFSNGMGVRPFPKKKRFPPFLPNYNQWAKPTFLANFSINQKFYLQNFFSFGFFSGFLFFLRGEPNQAAFFPHFLSYDFWERGIFSQLFFIMFYDKNLIIYFLAPNFPQQ